MAQKTEQHEDRWVPTMCGGCYGGSDPIKVHLVDGVVVKIEGDPDMPLYNGRICPRGNAQIMRLYDPYRLKAPMKRTNPRKGFDQDPGWVEISWEEAIDKLVEKLSKVRQENPRGLYTGTMDEAGMIVLSTFQTVFGIEPMTVWFSGAGAMCGEPIHQLGGPLHGAHIDFPDLRLAKYAIITGGSLGEGWMATTINPQIMAERREKAGLKVVVIDPQQTLSAAKADEWIPIRPATDLALFLAMMEVLVHELGVYDRQFLKRQTNACYLIDKDGNYVKDRETGKPLVWDSVEERAKTFDDSTIKDFALEGSYRVENAAGPECSDTESKPAFQLFKDHIIQYMPEWAAEITTIPAETIRRITAELGEAAQIGSTIVLDGKEYAYRPVSITAYRGTNNHTNGPQTEFARSVLNMLLGANRAPGGLASLDMRSNHSEWPIPYPAHDNGLTKGEFFTLETPWKFPFEDVSLKALAGRHIFGTHLAFLGTADPERYGIAETALPKVLLHWRANPLMNGADPKKVAEGLSKIPFYVDFTLFMDESDQFADMVIPDCHWLERYACNNTTAIFEGVEVQQPVVSPMYKSRSAIEVIWEIADRMGLLTGPAGMLMMFNISAAIRERASGIGLDKPWILDAERKYSYKEYLDTHLSKVTGHDLAWFEEHGHNLKLCPPERYYYPWGWNQHRLPFYFEELKRRGEELRENMERDRVKEKVGLDPDVWCRQFWPIPTWEPAVIHKEDPKYDMYAASRRTSVTRGSTLPATNPWLMEIAETDPYHLKVKINTQTAKNKGIKDGDLVWVESEVARVKAKAKLTECVHHELVGFSSNLGHWMKHSIAGGKGAHFNTLLPLDLEHHQPVAIGLEGTAKVRIYRVQEGD